MFNFNLLTASDYNEFTTNFEEIATDKGEIIKDFDRKARIDINDSSVMTNLIKAVGKNVDHFASDLLVDLRKVNQLIEKRRQHFEDNVLKMERIIDVFKFGLRESGVDGNEEIQCRFADSDFNPFKTYKAMYYLVVTTNPCKYTNNRIDITMSLFRDKNFYEEVR